MHPNPSMEIKYERSYVSTCHRKQQQTLVKYGIGVWTPIPAWQCETQCQNSRAVVSSVILITTVRRAWWGRENDAALIPEFWAKGSAGRIA